MDDWEKFSETSLPEEDLKQSSKHRRLLTQIMCIWKEFVKILKQKIKWDIMI